jgi:hypothetical protein
MSYPTLTRPGVALDLANAGLVKTDPDTQLCLRQIARLAQRTQMGCQLRGS